MLRNKLIQALLTACIALLMVSCSDNDDNNGYFGGETDDGIPTVDRVNPAQVFTGRLPLSAAGMVISYNENGLVKQITKRESGENEIASFSYPSLSRTVSESKLVRMDVVSGNERHQFNLRIGNLGFVEYAEETEYDGNKAEDTEYWWFEYSPEGHLLSIDRTDEDRQHVEFSYLNHNITKMRLTNRDAEDLETTLDYGADPKSNIGGVMMFDEIFNTDLDEMEFAYYAGLLGKATADLPQRATQRSGRHAEDVTFTWTLDQEGYPTTMSPSNEPFAYTFTWK